jgi:hypothetical protein
MSAVLSPDGLTVTLRGVRWSQVFAVAELPGKLRFYRGLAERGGKGKGLLGPFARHYAVTIAALEQVSREVAA